MALTDRQAQIRDLVLDVADDAEFKLLGEFNPFNVTVRADQSGDRPWGHGGWSGAEHAETRTVRIRVAVQGTDAGSWLASHQRLVAAFRPIGDDTDPVECRFALGGREYVMFGRPRMVEEDARIIGTGQSYAQCGFVALDPRIYDATETSVTFGLPTFTGGFTFPLTFPFTIDATATDGEATLTNEGTTDTGLTLKITGPVSEPRVTVQGPDGSVSTFRYLGDVPSGRFLLVKGKEVLIDGLPQSNYRGQATWTDPDGLRLPGNPDGSGATSTVLFRAADNEASGTLEVSARSAWW